MQKAGLATPENIRRMLQTLVPAEVKQVSGLKHWSLICRIRNNREIKKVQVLKWTTELMPSDLFHLDYNGDISVFVDISQNFACLSLLREWGKYRQYSVIKHINKMRGKNPP